MAVVNFRGGVGNHGQGGLVHHHGNRARDRLIGVQIGWCEDHRQNLRGASGHDRASRLAVTERTSHSRGGVELGGREFRAVGDGRRGWPCDIWSHRGWAVDGQRAADRDERVVERLQFRDIRRDGVGTHSRGGDGRAGVADGTGHHRGAVSVGKTCHNVGEGGEGRTIGGLALAAGGNGENRLVDGERAIGGNQRIVAGRKAGKNRCDHITAGTHGAHSRAAVSDGAGNGGGGVTGNQATVGAGEAGERQAVEGFGLRVGGNGDHSLGDIDNHRF